MDFAQRKEGRNGRGLRRGGRLVRVRLSSLSFTWPYNLQAQTLVCGTNVNVECMIARSNKDTVG